LPDRKDKILTEESLIDLERYFLPRSFLLFANYTNPDFLNIIGIITKEGVVVL